MPAGPTGREKALDATPGTYYLGFLVDSGGALGEGNEGNNSQPMPRTITIYGTQVRGAPRRTRFVAPVPATPVPLRQNRAARRPQRRADT